MNHRPIVIKGYTGQGMNVTAIYPGTFDPITRGHMDLAQRAARQFQRVIIAVAGSTGKNTCFDVAERIELATQALADVDNIEVTSFAGLLVNFAHKRGAQVIVRGLRAVSDFEYEFQLASMNRKLAPDLETIFMTPDDGFTYVSSSLVREIAKYGGDVTAFLHPKVNDALLERLAGR